ncbi:hypothetical protein [Sandaracinus amylolyticus]|uniref:Uncharacterized protein n=1 Tax=Sandaracinus amylolyticus TaxID=927083 RepID=A0A0F6W687_9BACT|nr:hypothetical protein [Sandaracinus amylolyticus]AKF08346.1 hypothetical protein DB32_005495 [Sandaracinus amylolyticus]
MPSPLLGYNNNVRHRGKIFHIQTEDSGVTHAHIFTHLFADGGRIIATKKTTYAQYLGTERFPGIVKKLMQAQHKAMFIALRDGLFDEDEVAGARAFAERPIVLEEDATQPTSVVAPTASRPEVDVDALERAAAQLSGGYTPPSAPAKPAPAAKSPPIPPAPSRAAQPVAAAARPVTPAAAVKPPSNRPRYQATQPASVRPRAPKQNESLFGADILSEKSLDEVIMSYLAEDLDEKE